MPRKNTGKSTFNPKQTSKKVAKIDSKLLRNNSSTKNVKSAAGGGLSQTPFKSKGKK